MNPDTSSECQWVLTNPELLTGGSGVPMGTQSSSYLIFRGPNVLNSCANDLVLNISYVFYNLTFMIVLLHKYYSNFHFRNEEKLHCDTTLHLLEWPLSTRQAVTSVREVVKKKGTLIHCW